MLPKENTNVSAFCIPKGCHYVAILIKAHISDFANIIIEIRMMASIGS